MSYAATPNTLRTIPATKYVAVAPARLARPTDYATPATTRIATLLETGLGLAIMSGLSLLLCTIAAAAIL